MKKYIFTARNDIYILDLETTVGLIDEAYAFIIKDFSQVQISNHIITGANFLAFVYGEGEQNAFGYTMGVTAKLPNSKMFVNGIDIEDVSNVKTQFCVRDSIILNAKTSVAYDTIVWLLGDGNRLTGETIKYAYNDSGNFTISMQVVVNSAECPLAEVKFDVLIKKNPNSSITTIKSEICEGDSVTLIAPSDYTSYVWNNATTTTLNSLVIYPTTDTNFYVDVYDEFGCDSISDSILIVVNKRPIADLTTSNSTICQGDSIVLRVSSSVNDTSFQWNTGLTTKLDSLVLFPTRDSSYCVKITNDHGCDSTSNVLSVIVNPIYKDTIIKSICNGDSYTFHGKDYTQDTIHTDTLQTINSCDSLVTLILTILPTYDDTTVTEICQEEVYPFSGTNYDQTGIYTHRLKTTAGCDSIVTLNLTVNPIYRDTTFIEICQGELYTFRGKDYDQTGLYADSLKHFFNCNAIIVLSHLGSKKETANICDVELIQNTSNIDIVLSGHSHIDTNVYINNINNKPVLLFGTESKGRKIGKILLSVD